MTGNSRASVLLVIAAMAAAGCGTASSTAPQRSPAAVAAVAAQPANPVPILRETGAHVPAGVRLGDHDIYGDRMAQGTMARWETIAVYTAASSSALRVMLARQAFTPDDYNGVITVPAERAAIVVSAWEDNGPHWARGGTPAQIARKVGGQLIGG